MEIDIDSIIKIETFNMNEIDFNSDYIVSGNVLEEYYTEDEYTQKIIDLDLGANHFIYSQNRRNDCFIRSGWGIIKVTYKVHGKNNAFNKVVYFIKKVDIDNLIKTIKNTIALSAAHKNLLGIGYTIEKSLLTSIIPVRYKLNTIVLLDRTMFNKFFKGIDYENIQVKESDIFDKNNNITPLPLTNEYIRENYYDLKYVLHIFNMKSPRFIANLDFEQMGISYIKSDGLYFFKKDDVDTQYEKFKGSITVPNARKIMSEFDGSFKQFQFSSMCYYISITGWITYVDINRFNKFRNYIISLYTKLNNENMTLYDVYLKYSSHLLDENYNEDNILYELNNTDGYLNFEQVKEWLYKNIKLETTHNGNIRNRIASFIERNKWVINDKIILIINGNYFVSEKYLEEQINLLNDSVTAEVLTNLGVSLLDGVSSQVKNTLKRADIDIYKIDFLYANEWFISKYDYNDLTNRIALKELLTLINEEVFKGYEFCLYYLPPILCELDNILKNGSISINRKFLYRKDDVEIFMNNLKGKVYDKGIITLYNMTVNEYENINVNTLYEDYYTHEEFVNILEKHDISCIEGVKSKKSQINIKALLNNTDIKNIYFYKRESFYSKREVDKAVAKAKQYTNKESIEREYGLSLTWSDIDNYKETDIPLLNVKSVWIKKVLVRKIVNDTLLKNELRDCSTLNDTVLTKIKYYKLDEGNEHKGDNIPNTINHLLEYILNVSNSKALIATWSNSNETYFIVYKLLCDNFNKEIEYMTEEELKKIFDKIKFIGTTINAFQTLVRFNNYLYRKHISPTDIDIEYDKEIVPIEPYKDNEYINLLICLADISSDNEKIKKLYRNWGKSSSVLYVFLHLCLGWRQGDIMLKLPSPNILYLGLGNISGEEFIQWLEKGNEIDDKTSKNICDDIKDTIESLREKTGKTKADLFCVIPYQLQKIIALLILINWANRDIVKNIVSESNNTGKLDSISGRYFRTDTSLNFMKNYIKKDIITGVFISVFNVDLKEMLDGGFLGTRAVKSFFKLIAEKSEELGLAYGYYVAQRMRSHKVSNWSNEEPKVLSNTTKIYIDKDISVTSVNAFAMGTMSCIRHILLGLVDGSYESLDRSTQVDMIKGFGVKLTEIEDMYRLLDQKSTFLKEQLNKYLTTTSKKENFLKLALYGSGGEAYECSENCKCIFKILKNVDNTIDSIGISKKINCPIKDNKSSNCIIGCKYLLPSRYFIYEFEREFNDLLSQIENTESDFIRSIHIERFNKLFKPLIVDMMDVWGKEQVKEMLDIDRYNSVKRINRG